MSTNETRVILITPDELREVIQLANQPLIDRLIIVEKKIAQEKISYSTEEVARLLTVSARSVRSWISEGKEDARGKRHYLKARELTRGRFVCELPDVQEFIRHF